MFAGEPETALKLLEQAESLDPYLPAWITEERIAAHYSLERYEESLEAGRSLAFQTRRSRLYRAACRVALNDIEAARELVSEAVAEVPTLTQSYIRENEYYKDRDILQLLLARLDEAGLPQ